jgi:hypothetical protein
VGDTGSEKLDDLLTRGGMESMLGTIWLILSALCFGSIFEQMGLLNRLTEPLVHRMKSVGSMVAGIVSTCLGANIITSDQYIAIVLPGRIFKAASEAGTAAGPGCQHARRCRDRDVAAILNSCSLYGSARQKQLAICSSPTDQSGHGRVRGLHHVLHPEAPGGAGATFDDRIAEVRQATGIRPVA